jgi:transposase
LTNVEIARRLDTAPEVVANWRRRFRLERFEGLQDRARSGRPRRFLPQEVPQVKAVACELPRDLGVPLSRFSRAELRRLVIERVVCEASASTIARWLSEDAIRPWQHRSWIFPRDPRFLERAGPVLDLYQRRWQGELLHPGDLVICADETAPTQ